MLSNNGHLLILLLVGNKRKSYFPGPILPPLIVLTNHSSADKIVFLLLPDCKSHFNFIYLL